MTCWVITLFGCNQKMTVPEETSSIILKLAYMFFRLLNKLTKLLTAMISRNNLGQQPYWDGNPVVFCEGEKIQSSDIIEKHLLTWHKSMSSDFQSKFIQIWINRYVWLIQHDLHGPFQYWLVFYDYSKVLIVFLDCQLVIFLIVYQKPRDAESPQ